MNQEILDQLQKEEEGIHIRNPDEKSKLLETVNALLRSVEELREQISGPPTVYELIRAKQDAEIDLLWVTHPQITHWIDYALCGSNWAIRGLPYRELPTIFKEAIADFGEDWMDELEQEMESSLIRDEDGEIQSQGDMTDNHVLFCSWLEHYSCCKPY